MSKTVSPIREQLKIRALSGMFISIPFRLGWRETAKLASHPTNTLVERRLSSVQYISLIEIVCATPGKATITAITELVDTIRSYEPLCSVRLPVYNNE
jgi:hypothetical protein